MYKKNKQQVFLFDLRERMKGKEFERGQIAERTRGNSPPKSRIGPTLCSVSHVTCQAQRGEVDSQLGMRKAPGILSQSRREKLSGQVRAVERETLVICIYRDDSDVKRPVPEEVGAGTPWPTPTLSLRPPPRHLAQS